MGQKIWCHWRHGPHTAIFQKSAGGGGVSHTRTGPGRPPGVVLQAVSVSFVCGKVFLWRCSLLKLLRQKGVRVWACVRVCVCVCVCAWTLGAATGLS